jgi:predicted dehydrogenase
MKQIFQNLKTGELEISDIPVPSIKAGHLLVLTSKSLVSPGTERMLLNFGRAGWISKASLQPDRVRQVIQKVRTDGLKPAVNAVLNKLDQPLPLGYSNAGVVIEVGEGVAGFNVGDRIVSNGHHAEVVCVPENLCEKIPDNVSDTTASFTVLSAIALQGIRLMSPTIGESVAVMGLGLIGLLACQILRANGCRVIGIDFDRKKLEIAEKYGIEICDLGKGTDPVSSALSFSNGYGVDAVLIAASTKSNDPIRQAPAMCRKRGRVVLVGVVGLELSRDDFYKKEISFQVSCSYGPGRYDDKYEKKGLDYPIGYVRWTEKRNFQAVLQLMTDGQIKTADLVSGIYPIHDAVNVYDELASKENIMGIVLDYDGKVDVTRKEVRITGKRSYDRGIEIPVVGFLGSGGFTSSTLVPAFRKCNVRLKTIASSSGLTSSHVGGKYGFEINTTDYRNILEDPEINTVVITTRHDTHARFVIESLKAGKNIFVEKPLCMTGDELDEISRIYEESININNLILMVGFNRRFALFIQKMKKLISPFTEPKCFIMTVNAGNIPMEHWVQDKNIGGGRIVGEVCHFIDLLRFLAGTEIVKYGMVKLSDRSDDTISISLCFADGSIGTIHYFANGNKNFPKERLEVFCGGKILQLDNFKKLKGHGIAGFRNAHLLNQDKGHQQEAAAFLNAIEKGKPSPIPLEEILEVSKVTLDLSKKTKDA